MYIFYSQLNKDYELEIKKEHSSIKLEPKNRKNEKAQFHDRV